MGIERKDAGKIQAETWRIAGRGINRNCEFGDKFASFALLACWSPNHPAGRWGGPARPRGMGGGRGGLTGHQRAEGTTKVLPQRDTGSIYAGATPGKRRPRPEPP